MQFTTGTGMQDNGSTNGEEQRGAPRYTSLIRAAKLVCGQGEFVCVIRDVSATGVSLRTFHRLPRRITATVMGATIAHTPKAQDIWRTGFGVWKNQVDTTHPMSNATR